jgi:hypothetical protein
LYTSLPDSPQGIGDLIGLAFRMVRRNIGEIFRFILVPSIFTLAAGVVFQWAFTYGTAGVAETKSVSGAVSLLLAVLVGTLVFSVSWWILGMRLLALTRVVLGFASSLDEAWKYMLKRMWSLAGLYWLSVALVFGATFCWMMVMFMGIFVGSAMGEVGKMLLSALAVVVGVLGIAGTFSFYLLAANIAFCVLACEDIPVGTVVNRSIQLTSKHIWRALAFGSVFMVTYAIISYPLSLPVMVVAFIDALTNGLANAGAGMAGAYKPPLYLLVITQVWEAGMGIILRPLMAFAFGLLYYDMRLRNEGIDIERKLRASETS